MRKSILGLSALAILASAAPAFAADEADAGPFAITGNVAIVSDYRFRGFSQSGQNVAVQGGVTATTSSGFYFGTWGSSISFAGNAEIDLFAGYSTKLNDAVTVDVGVLYYLYPKHKSVTGDINTDFFEPYINLTGAVGPLTVKVGANYAWKQDALTATVCDSATESCSTSRKDALYLHVEPSIAVAGTPFGLNAHLGYATSDAFPGGTDGEVFDWSLGATATYKMLTFGVSYVDTDEPSYIRGTDSAVVFSLTAAF